MPNLDLIKLEQEHAQMLDQIGEGPTSISPGGGGVAACIVVVAAVVVLLIIIAVVLAFANGV